MKHKKQKFKPVQLPPNADFEWMLRVMSIGHLEVGPDGVLTIPVTPITPARWDEKTAQACGWKQLTLQEFQQQYLGEG